MAEKRRKKKTKTSTFKRVYGGVVSPQGQKRQCYDFELDKDVAISTILPILGPADSLGPEPRLMHPDDFRLSSPSAARLPRCKSMMIPE